MTTEVVEQIPEIHKRSLVLDAAGTLLKPDSIEEDLAEARAASLDVIFITVGGSKDDLKSSIKNMSDWYLTLNERPNDIALITSLADIRKYVKEAGKIGVVFHFQGTKPFDGDVKLVESFYRLGVRVVGITYNELNLVGAGCTEKVDCGLSDYGVALIKEMNRLDILIDLTHAGAKTSMEAIEVSEKLVVFTHSNCRALTDHPRNISDDHIRAAADKGGMVGICVFPDFVGPTVADVIDHVDHVVKLTSVEHVGFGLDLNTHGDMNMFKTLQFKPEFYSKPPWKFPQGIERNSKFPNLTNELVNRGYSEVDIEKILGGNFLRVLNEVWKK